MREHRGFAFRSSTRLMAALVSVALAAGVLITAATAAGAAVHADVATTITTFSTGSPVVKGNPISLFADVNCGPVVVPTGTLSYFENGNANPLGTLPLDGNGEATLDATALITTVGVHTLHVSYSGDANCAPSQSVDRTLEIDGSSVNLTTGTFRTLGFPIKLQADVSCGATVPTGTASFFENGNAVALGQVPLDADGSAVLDLTNTLTVPGNHVYHATYSGDASCTSATSADRQLIVLPNDPVQRYVDFVYQYLFGRVAEPEGLQYWVTLIRGGVDRSALGWALVNSDEHRVNVINTAFEKYLGREVDPSGTAFFLQKTGPGGQSFLYVDLFAIGSDEYYAQAGGTPVAFLDRIYADLLHRAPDPTGEAYQLQLLSSGVPRYLVAGGILYSQEYLGSVVDGLYVGLLGRHLDASGRAYWVAQLQNGMPLQVLVALLVGSSELFFNLTGIHA